MRKIDPFSNGEKLVTKGSLNLPIKVRDQGEASAHMKTNVHIGQTNQHIHTHIHTHLIDGFLEVWQENNVSVGVDDHL